MRALLLVIAFVINGCSATFTAIHMLVAKEAPFESRERGPLVEVHTIAKLDLVFDGEPRAICRTQIERSFLPGMESHRSRASVWLGWAQPLAAIDFSASWLGFAWTADAAFAKGGPSPWLPAAATLFALSTLSWTATAAYAIAHERDADDSFAIRFGSLPPPPPPTVSGDDGCAGGTLEWTSGADVLVLALHDDGRVSQRGRALAFLRAHPDVSVRASLGPLQSLLRIDPAQRCAMLRQGREAMNDAEIADARRSCAIGWRR